MTNPRTVSISAASLLVAGAQLIALPAQAQEDYDDRDDRRDSSFARAHIAADFDVGDLVDDPLTGGQGGALRFGSELDLLLISLIPEGGVSYHSFGDESDDRLRIYSGFIGGRLAVGKIIEPSIFSHVGVAWLRGNERRTAPVIDAGVALDFTLLPLINLGVHGTYNIIPAVDEDPSRSWVLLGMHAALVF